MIETILTDLLKRIQVLEEFKRQLGTKNKTAPTWITNPNKPATEGQIIALEKRGLETWNGMTQKDVSEQFKKLNNPRAPDMDEINAIEEGIKQEPKEVDTDEAGVDEEGCI